ncbi:hypothetical protein RDWZM_005365, partial [Blomia tropicalis]
VSDFFSQLPVGRSVGRSALGRAQAIYKLYYYIRLCTRYRSFMYCKGVEVKWRYRELCCKMGAEQSIYRF